jgi:holo-[acyl-carrier protein] synthase
MIKGMGIDLVDLDRIREIADDRFIHRILSDEEFKIYENIADDTTKITFLGGRFAAKEAIFKAISKGKGTAYYTDFSVLPDDHGKPYVVSEYFSDDVTVHITITHTATHAICYALIEG